MQFVIYKCQLGFQALARNAYDLTPQVDKQMVTDGSSQLLLPTEVQ